ncbi:MAG: peptidase domain-containing ABC transporter [Pseudomonadota bacterium]
MKKLRIIRQRELMDCGPACLAMINQYYGNTLTFKEARQLCDKTNRGVSFLSLRKAADELGFRTKAVKLSRQAFLTKAELPCIVHWHGDHFVVIYKTTRNHVYVADPRVGKLKVTHDEFGECWCRADGQGLALFLYPGEDFVQKTSVEKTRLGAFRRLGHHVFRYTSLLGQLGLGAVVGAVLNLVFPFLTQALVDHGIGARDLNFVYVILIAQLVLFASKAATEFIRGWIVVHVGTRVNISLIADFLAKLTRLPMSQFGRTNLGDMLQRIHDHKKIEEFLTFHTVNTLFSLLNLVFFSIVMAVYSGTIFAIFLFGSAASIVWVLLFLNRRKVLDYRQFHHMANNHDAIVELVTGMPEIRMNQCEESRNTNWQRIQGKLFRVRLDALAVEQYQQAGNVFINEAKNIFITFVAAFQVIQGEMTLGMLMAVSYILGQMNAPIEQMLSFIRLGQDAKISLDRLGEIQEMPDEISPERQYLTTAPSGDIGISSLRFAYDRHSKSCALNELSLTIPHRKTTAVVGVSGSGKTTLLKLLLQFYRPSGGRITVGGHGLELIRPDTWRSQCGTVLQDGHIFNDTVANNIALTSDPLDVERLMHAARTANIHDEIEVLPNGYFTKIGPEGVRLSGGQMQRVLIARAVYKNPKYLFLDEATSALDAHNERIIHDNLQYFFKGRTVLIIAHRLSTVRNADQVIVLDEGRVVECGPHEELVGARGHYFNLVKNQLELGN